MRTILLILTALTTFTTSAWAEPPPGGSGFQRNVGIADAVVAQAERLKVRSDVRSLVYPSMRMASYGVDLYRDQVQNVDYSYQVRVRAGIARDVRDRQAGVQVQVSW